MAHLREREKGGELKYQYTEKVAQLRKEALKLEAANLQTDC